MLEGLMKPAFGRSEGGRTTLGFPEEPLSILRDVVSAEPRGIAMNYGGKRWVFDGEEFSKVQNEVIDRSYKIPNVSKMSFPEIVAFLTRVENDIERITNPDEQYSAVIKFQEACSKFET